MMISSNSKFSKSEKELEDGEIEEFSIEDISDEENFDLYENSQITFFSTGFYKKMDENETISLRPSFSDLSSDDSDYSDSVGRRKRSNFRLRTRSTQKKSSIAFDLNLDNSSRILPEILPNLDLRPIRQPRIVFDLENSVQKAEEVSQLDICKYYLKNNCHRNDCNFMHSEFPCKYYYLGLICPAKDCLYLHGGPLSDFLKKVLVDHIQSAPQSILGKFNRYGRFKAGKLIDEFNLKLKKDDEVIPNSNNNEDPIAKKTRWDVKSENYLNLNKLEGILSAAQIQLLADNKIYTLLEISQLSRMKLKEFNFSDKLIEELMNNIKNLKELGLPVDKTPFFVNPEKILTKSSVNDLFSFSNQVVSDDLPSCNVVPHYQMNLGNGHGSPFYEDIDLKKVSFEMEQTMQQPASINYSQCVSEFLYTIDDLDEVDNEEQLIIDEQSEKEEEEETEIDSQEFLTVDMNCSPHKKSSVMEADSTDDKFEENRYNSFFSNSVRNSVELKSEIQVNQVDSEFIAEKNHIEDDCGQYPFKPFKTESFPATEIIASISTHPVIPYKLIEIEIPAVCRKKIYDNSILLLDPRMKFYSIDEKVISSKLKLKMILQKSDWFRNVSPLQNQMITDQINFLAIELENFEKKISLGKIFDVEIISKNTILQAILKNLNFFVNADGEIIEF